MSLLLALESPHRRRGSAFPGRLLSKARRRPGLPFVVVLDRLHLSSARLVQALRPHMLLNAFVKSRAALERRPSVSLGRAQGPRTEVVVGGSARAFPPLFVSGALIDPPADGRPFRIDARPWASRAPHTSATSLMRVQIKPCIPLQLLGWMLKSS